MTIKTLGILELENRPLSHPGALAGPGTFTVPVIRAKVAGATAATISAGDPVVRDAYIAAAQSLERAGATAITTNCGFTSVFQANIAAAVSVPVACSSLLMVPLIAQMLPQGARIGILTFDAEKLQERHFNAAGWSSDRIPVAVKGIEGSETWRQLMRPVPEVTPEQIARDVMAAVHALRDAHSDIGGLLFECAGFTHMVDEARRETGLLIADFVSMINCVLATSPVRG